MSDEKEKQWREEFEEYVASTNRDVDMQRKLEWEFYFAGRKAGQVENERLRSENEKFKKESLKRLNEMLNDHRVKNYKITKELVKRAKPFVQYVQTDNEKEILEKEQWLSDFETVMDEGAGSEII